MLRCARQHVFFSLALSFEIGGCSILAGIYCFLCQKWAPPVEWRAKNCWVLVAFEYRLRILVLPYLVISRNSHIWKKKRIEKEEIRRPELQRRRRYAAEEVFQCTVRKRFNLMLISYFCFSFNAVAEDLPCTSLFSYECGYVYHSCCHIENKVVVKILKFLFLMNYSYGSLTTNWKKHNLTTNSLHTIIKIK